MPLTKPDFEDYVGRQVKIIFKGEDNFFLKGVISEVRDGSFRFHTKQAKSTIDFDVVAQIVEMNGGD